MGEKFIPGHETGGTVIEVGKKVTSVKARFMSRKVFFKTICPEVSVYNLKKAETLITKIMKR